MMYMLILVGVVVSGFFAMFSLHFMFIVVELEMMDHYLMQFAKRLSKYIPDLVLISVGFLLMVVSLVVFISVVLVAFGMEDITLFRVYISGVGIYLIFVPMRLTFLPLIFRKLFPNGKFVD